MRALVELKAPPGSGYKKSVYPHQQATNPGFHGEHKRLFFDHPLSSSK